MRKFPLEFSSNFGHSGCLRDLHKDSSISEWKLNGTHIFGRPNRKITGINGLLERAVARALIGGGGGGVYSHIFVLCPTDFF